MALQKNIDTAMGVQSQYHKVTKVSYNGFEKTYNITVASYADKDTSQKNPFYALKTKGYSLDSSTIKFDAPLLSQVYDLLKVNEDFTGSKDV